MDYILGGGLSGLVWAFYNDMKIISPQLGGQVASHFPLGPRYLHATPEAEQLLDDLHIKTTKRIVTVGYLEPTSTNPLKMVDTPNEQFRIDYFKKSRQTDDLSQLDDSVMTGGSNTFEVLCVGMDTLAGRLVERIVEQGKFIQDTIQRVDLNGKILINSQGFPRAFTHLVSTIPLNSFCNMIGISIYLEATDTAFALSDECFRFSNRYDYVYHSGDEYPFHRVSYWNNYFVFEFPGNVTDKEIRAYLDTGYKDRKRLEGVQLISPTPPDCLHINGVTLSGRYAQWDHHIKLNNVIKEAQEFGD
jgi:hypothetical protein